MQRKIILLIVILLVVSSFWLFGAEKKYFNPNFQSSWWSIYFGNPKESEISFAIENHSNQNNFNWEILAGESKIESGEIEVLLGEKKIINLENINLPKEKITVVVFDGIEKKEIYKILK